jgi:hypothetical protein
MCQAKIRLAAVAMRNSLVIHNLLLDIQPKGLLTAGNTLRQQGRLAATTATNKNGPYVAR